MLPCNQHLYSTVVIFTIFAETKFSSWGHHVREGVKASPINVQSDNHIDPSEEGAVQSSNSAHTCNAVN